MNEHTNLKPNSERKYAHVLRPLLDGEKAKLRASLQQDGLLSDLIRDQHGDLLDGHHREDMCRELGIDPRYRQVTVVGDPVHWIKGMQAARRNLNREEMQQLEIETVIANPTMSDNQIAKMLNVSHTTIGKVRTDLINEGKVDNVVRVDKRGYKSSSGRPAPTCQVGKSDLSEPSEKPDPEKPVKRKTKAPLLELKNGKLQGLAECVLHHCADTDKFYSIAQMIALVDPENHFKLTPTMFHQLTYRFDHGSMNIRMETRPVAGNQKHYRFYRQGKTIGLSVLKAKFRPVIAELKEMADFPISYQTTGRILKAANLLTQLLRELEAE